MDMNMDMNMVMTFRSWSEYQLKVVFESWDVTEKWQFGLTWIFVFFCAFGIHPLRRFILGIEEKMAYMTTDGHRRLVSGTNKVAVSLRVVHAVLAGLSYTLSNLLMLVVMTMNPMLFLSVILGYSVGDFFFFARSSSAENQCH